MSTVSASPSRRFGFPFRKATWLKGLFAVAVAAAAVYWYGFSSITVKGVEVRQGDIAAEVMGTGTLEARRKATLSPRIAGRITEISADQGDQVEAGEPLIRLDDEELLQQVEVAKASIEAAAAAIGRFEAERSQAAAILKQATADYSRTEKLVQSNASTVADLDRAREHLDVATAGIARADAAIAEARQQRRVAESTMAYHEARLADTRIVAPFSGLIVRRYRDPGSIAVPGSSVLGLISTDELWVVAWVDETEMSRLEIGQPAQVLFRSEATNEFAGEVARLGREADRETREFIVEVRVLDLPKNWAVGQRADVLIRTDFRSGAPLLPNDAIVWNDGEPGVLVSRNGTARWVPVSLGLRNREDVEILAGVQIGDQVLLPNSVSEPTLIGRRVRIR